MAKRVISQKAGQLSPTEFREKYLVGRKEGTQKRYLSEYLRQQKEPDSYAEKWEIGQQAIRERLKEIEKRYPPAPPLPPKPRYIGGVALCLVIHEYEDEPNIGRDNKREHYCHFVVDERDRFSTDLFNRLHDIHYPSHQRLMTYNIHRGW